MKEQWKQWIETGGSAPKKTKMVPSAGKVMATVFWDYKGGLQIDYVQKGKTIICEYYLNFLDQFDAKIHFSSRQCACSPSALTMVKFNTLKYELFEHPAYLPDLAPSDYYLFPNMKKFLAGKRFTSNDEAIAAVDGYFAGLPVSNSNDGIELLKKRWNKCIEVSGDYNEK